MDRIRPVRPFNTLLKQSVRPLSAVCVVAVFGCLILSGVGNAAPPESSTTSGAVSGPLVISERWPQATNLTSWTRDVMRIEDLERASETAQGKAFFRWLRLFNRMAVGGMIQAFEGEYGDERYVIDSHKNLFVYGWGFCDTTSRIAEAAWREFKKDPKAAERVVVRHPNLGYHTMYRLRLDGNYGAFDPRFGYYLVDRDAPDARILDWTEVGNDENFHRNKTFKHRSTPFFEFFGFEWDRALDLQPAYFNSEPEWKKGGEPNEVVFGNGMYKMGTPLHDMNFRLLKGMVIERFWDNTAKKFYVPVLKRAQKEEPFLPSGRFYRITETMLDGNWVKYDPNYQKAKPYLVTVPKNEGYNKDVAGGRTLGQAWGKITYKPVLSDPASRDALTGDSDLVQAQSAPFLRAAEKKGGQSIFDFYSPYVLVDGTLKGELAGTQEDGLKLEIRVLKPKVLNRVEPDRWTPWQVLKAGPGQFEIALGRERFNGKDVSIHGNYRFQVRVSAAANASRVKPAGLSDFGLQVYFENNIMSIPQIFAGRNTVHFKLADATKLRGPVKVTYNYQTSTGKASSDKTLRPADFKAGSATYSFEAPGLVRCTSVAVAY